MPRFWPYICVLGVSLTAFVTGQSSAKCRSITLHVELSSGSAFYKVIGENLLFKIEPGKLGPKSEASGWSFALTPASGADHDYIYPVNPPLRFNGEQTLGPGYGDDAKASLDRRREMNFLLNAADYDRMWPLVTDALWPYNVSDPDKTAAIYFDALKALAVGHLSIIIQSHDIDPATDFIRSIRLTAEFTAPDNFTFEPTLKPRPARCIVATE
jgi:hypothetical protein